MNFAAPLATPLAMRAPTTNLPGLLLLFALLSGAGCPAPKPENAAAKERLSAPAPPDPMRALADESLAAGALVEDKEARDRIMRMSIQEVALRLGTFRLKTRGSLRFARTDVKVNSAEEVDIVMGNAGHFTIHVVTGDESEQHVAYLNDILFLKNNNGRWRASRDPVGERDELLADSAGIWRSFYDLFAHTLVWQKSGSARSEGRDVVRYAITLPERSADALALSPAPAAPATLADGGPAPLDPAEERRRIRDRVSRWRERARPAGGRGEVRVDAQSGALLSVRFEGALAVGDGPEPARLEVNLAHDVSEIGANHEIQAPKDAIDEIVRKKWPTNPRAELEKAGLVAPEPEPEPAEPGGAPGSTP